MDVRQFLLDAPDTCFFTCYDLLLHRKDGSVHQIDDYSEISEVGDITAGDCSLEMVAGMLVCHSWLPSKLISAILKMTLLSLLSIFLCLNFLLLPNAIF